MKIANKFSRCLAAWVWSSSSPRVQFALFLFLSLCVCIMFTFLWPPAAVRCNNYTTESTVQQNTNKNKTQSAKQQNMRRIHSFPLTNLNSSRPKQRLFLEASLGRKKNRNKLWLLRFVFAALIIYRLESYYCFFFSPYIA